jgi:hypothetical protein
VPASADRRLEALTIPLFCRYICLGCYATSIPTRSAKLLHAVGQVGRPADRSASGAQAGHLGNSEDEEDKTAAYQHKKSPDNLLDGALVPQTVPVFMGESVMGQKGQFQHDKPDNQP